MNLVISPFARKLGTYVDLSESELKVLESLHGRRKTYSAGRGMVHQGQPGQQAYVLAEGWARSYRLLADALCREFASPGAKYPALRRSEAAKFSVALQHQTETVAASCGIALTREKAGQN